MQAIEEMVLVPPGSKEDIDTIGIDKERPGKVGDRSPPRDRSSSSSEDQDGPNEG